MPAGSLCGFGLNTELGGPKWQLEQATLLLLLSRQKSCSLAHLASRPTKQRAHLFNASGNQQFIMSRSGRPLIGPHLATSACVPSCRLLARSLAARPTDRPNSERRQCKCAPIANLRSPGQWRSAKNEREIYTCFTGAAASCANWSRTVGPRCGSELAARPAQKLRLAPLAS